MIISSEKSSIEIDVFERVSTSNPRRIDTQLKISVASDGFAGDGTTWVDAEQIKSFLQQLRALEQGAELPVELNSMSPNEFRLHFARHNRRGHISISVQLAKHRFIEGKAFLHEVKFGFVIDGASFHKAWLEFENLLTDPAE